MGWQGGYGKSDCELKVRGEVTVNWTCLRCDHRNASKVQVDDLLNGDMLYCSNTAVCGHQQSYINFGIQSIDHSYKCPSSRPLTPVCPVCDSFGCCDSRIQHTYNENCLCKKR